MDEKRSMFDSKKGAVAISIGEILMLMITVVIGFALFPVLADSKADAVANGTAQEDSFLNLTTLLYVVLLLSIVAVQVTAMYKKVA